MGVIMKKDMMEKLQKFGMPRYEQVRWQIQCLLTENQWDTETPLPTESELASRYQVSVGTVRKAVEKLVEEGVLSKQQGRGTFLKPPNFESSLSRFFKFRNKNSAYVAPIGVVKKIVLIEGIKTINDKLNVAEAAKLIHLERVRMIDSQVILSEKIWLPQALFQSLMDVEPKNFSNLLYPFYYKKCQQFVSSATESLTFIQNHRDTYLNNAQSDSLVKVCRVAKNLAAEPIEYRESFGLAENFSYEISIT